MLKLQITHQQVYFHIATTTIPHTDKPPLFHIYSGLYFLGCARKYLYQYMIQKGLVQLKCVMYPLSEYIVYCTLHPMSTETPYTLTWGTVHASAGRDTYGSYINTNACLCSPGSINHYEC